MNIQKEYTINNDLSKYERVEAEKKGIKETIKWLQYIEIYFLDWYEEDAVVNVRIPFFSNPVDEPNEDRDEFFMFRVPALNIHIFLEDKDLQEDLKNDNELGYSVDKNKYNIENATTIFLSKDTFALFQTMYLINYSE